MWWGVALLLLALWVGASRAGWIDTGGSNSFLSRLGGGVRRHAHATHRGYGDSDTRSGALVPEPDPMPERARQIAAHFAPDAKVLVLEVLDVDQGDAILMTLPDGEHILMDAADKLLPSGQNPAHELLMPSLASRHLTKIDLAIASHPHEDHIGGFVEVMRTYPLHEFWDCGLSYSTRTYRDLLLELKSEHVAFNVPPTGFQRTLPDSVTLTVNQAPKDLFLDPNNHSLLVRVDYGTFSALLTGDMEDARARHVLDEGWFRPVTVLKAAHHGSHTSIFEGYLRAVRPQYIAISCGANNSYGHPHADALEAYRRLGGTLNRTDLDGTITYLTDGHTVVAYTARKRPS